MTCSHQWAVDQLEAAGPGIAIVWRCVLCRTVAYEPSAGDRGGRDGVRESRQPGVDRRADQSDMG